jgi:hypothetical protein
VQVKDLQAIAAPQGSGLRAETLNRASGLPVRSKVQKQSDPAATRLEMLDLAERLIGLPRVAAQAWAVVRAAAPEVPAAACEVAVGVEAAEADGVAEGGEAASRSGMTWPGLKIRSLVSTELAASPVIVALSAWPPRKCGMSCPEFMAK